MRKALLTLATAFLPALAAHALSVQINPSNTITVMGGYTQSVPLAARFTIVNTGSNSLTLGLQRQVLQDVPGSQNNFCFSTGCYPPSVSISPQPVTLAPGASDNSFVGDYEPLNYPGICIIRYAVYDMDGSGTSADTAYVTVTYDASRPNGLAEDLAQSTLLSAPAPNPAVAGAAVEFTVQRDQELGSGQLLLTSLADGRVVRRLDISPIGWCGNDFSHDLAALPSESRVSLPTHDLTAGLYACILVGADGRPRALRRLVVQ